MNSYEPDQDSFLFLDSLEKEYETIQHIDPYMIVEIGPGSGIISTFLTRIVSGSGETRSFVDAQHPTCTLAIDINEDACRVTKETYKENHVPVLAFFHGIDCIWRGHPRELAAGNAGAIEGFVGRECVNPRTRWTCCCSILPTSPQSPTRCFDRRSGRKWSCEDQSNRLMLAV